MTLDIINGCFEAGGALAIALSTRRLLRDKLVRGVHWGQVAFFMGWGVFNLLFYPSLHQRWSFLAGVAVVLSNALYLGMLLRYTFIERWDKGAT